MGLLHSVALAFLLAVPAPEPSLGHLEFEVTGSAECQRLFREGVLAMHSFQYDQAHASFAAALAADAGCAMAAWGDAMAYDHPVWSQRDTAKGRAALARITGEDRLTARERAFIASARAMYAPDEPKAGHRAWLAEMTKMRAAWPQDDEVALQHALALIALYGYDKSKQREQSQAGAIALDVLARRPQHPGAAHYVIHAFDNPEHAVLALPASHVYARIAPAAGHALHMPSHTFTHLGMWTDVVPSNVRAYAASQAAAAALGQDSSKWDWHSYSWLVAAHLELGQADRARTLVDEARTLLMTHDSPELRTGYADIVRTFVAQTGRWAETEMLVAPLLRPAGNETASGTVACAQHAPGGGGEERPPFVQLARVSAETLRAEAALRTGDAATAEARARDLMAVVEQMKPWATNRRAARLSAVAVAHASEILARARHVRNPTRENEALALAAITESVKLGDSLPISGPTFFFTARERFAEALLAAGRAEEALAQYEAEVDARPNRAVSLLGAARAARTAGHAARAQQHYAVLADLWRDADASLQAVVEVRAGSAAPAVEARASGRR